MGGLNRWHAHLGRRRRNRHPWRSGKSPRTATVGTAAVEVVARSEEAAAATVALETPEAVVSEAATMDRRLTIREGAVVEL